ncbi:hypothetical protein CCL15_12270 [Pseudomonas syringae]|nr:hypothetical protein CCL15_12270 [Pseudomonas syringae]
MQIFTISDFEKMAVRYSELFYSRSLRDGPKNIAYWISVFFFVLTLLTMLSSLGALTIGGEANTGLTVVSVLFEVLGLAVWFFFYEPTYRYDKIKKSGLNIPDLLCQKQNREAIKGIWLKKNLSVPPEKYLELTKNLYEIQAMLAESKKSRQIADRFLTGFFSLKPLQSLLSIPVILAIVNFVLKIPGVEFTVANIDFSVFMIAAARYSLALFLISITLVLIIGLLLMVCLGILELLGERYRGKCSDLTKRRFVKALLDRAALVW